MKTCKLSCFLVITLFLVSTFALVTVNAQGIELTNYVIKPDGSVEPSNSVITRVGNNYFLTQNITGMVTIQKDDAVFDGSGYTVKGNAVKGTYNLDDGILHLEAGFNLTRAWNVTVQNVRVENCVNGISLVNAYYCRILNCSITENAVDGMKIAWSSKNMVFWNDIVSNVDDAIQLFNAENNNIMINNMDPGTYYRANGNGLQLNGNCSANNIKGNNVTAFDTGIYIDTSGGNLTANIVSYNNIRNNDWNGAAIGGWNNTVSLNNFYTNGLNSTGDNNCSGNYWNTTPSTYDMSPLSAPVNTNITPEWILIPQSTKKPDYWSISQFMGPMIEPYHPKKATPTPTVTPNETTGPTTTPTPKPSNEPAQSANDLSIPLIVAAVISFVALVSVLVLRGKLGKALTKGYRSVPKHSSL